MAPGWRADITTACHAAKLPKKAMAVCMANGPCTGLATPTHKSKPGPKPSDRARRHSLDAGTAQSEALRWRLQWMAQASEGSSMASKPCSALCPKSNSAPITSKTRLRRVLR